MGLVGRAIEAAGFSTITLSNIPDLTGAVGIPRLLGIEFPFGRTLGQPGDAHGQTAVLRAALRAVGEMGRPGSVSHLPFKWPDVGLDAPSHAAQLSPIAIHLKRHPWQLPRLLSRDIPR